MADADVPITAGAGTKIDTRTVGAGTDEHRQVVVIGDPATAANVASADAANGLDVDVTRLPALPAGTNNIGDVDIVSAPALTKGTQGSTGFSVQSLVDAGRVNIAWTSDIFQPAATTEALATITESRDGAATTTFTSKVITSGKRLRISGITLFGYNAGSTPVISRMFFRIRSNSAGATTTASPLQWIAMFQLAAAVRSGFTGNFVIPDGMEFLGDGTRTIGFTFTSPEWVTTTQLPTIGCSVTAFEY